MSFSQKVRPSGDSGGIWQVLPGGYGGLSKGLDRGDFEKVQLSLQGIKVCKKEFVLRVFGVKRFMQRRNGGYAC